MPMLADIERYRRNLRDERDGSALHAALAAAERDPVRKDLFLQLSQVEAEHAEVWEKKLTAAGIHDPLSGSGFKTRILSLLAKRFGPRFVLPAIAAAEFADRNKYAGQADAQPMFFSSASVPIGDPMALTSIAATRSLFAFTMNALDRIGCDGSG